MAVSLSVIAAKDSAGTAIPGGLQAQDKSGTNAGPFTLGQVLIDGVAGVNMAAVTAAGAVKVDGSAVTQPVSLTSTTITGTVAATQSGTWTVQPGNTANTTAWKVDGSAVTQPVSIATAPVLVAGSALIGKVDVQFAGTAPTRGAGAADASTQRVTIDSNQFSALGQATMSASAPVVFASDQSTIPAKMAISAIANGGTASRINAAATTNATNLKASPGQIYNIDVFNVAAYNVFLKLYNKASPPILALATPVNAAFSTSTSGGTLAATTAYFYRVSATNALGETLASTETSVTTGAGATNSNTVNWGVVTGAAGYKVYGRTTGAELLIATIGSGATVTFLDTGSVTPSGALPSVNATYDTPVMTIPIQTGGGYSKTWPMGKPCGTGISYAITKLQADSDATAILAGELTGSIDWI